MKPLVAEIPTVVTADDMPIVSEKKPPKQIHLRWDPSVVEDIDAIADRTGRTFNETSELLVRWAIQEEKLERKLAGEDPATIRRKKKES